MTAASKPESIAVARIEPGQKGFALRSKIGQVLMTQQAHAAIAALVPHGVDYEVVVAEAYRATVKNPDILKCTPESIIDAVAIVVQTGLTIGKTIHLVPVKDKDVEKLQAWNDYKGDVELVLRAGAVKSIYAHPVYEHDVFHVELGSSPSIVHRPVMDPKKRGGLIGAYCIAVMNVAGTIRQVEWMPLDDIEKVRANSRAWKPAKVPVCPSWYAVKTVFHKMCKVLPKSDRMAQIVAIQERQLQQDAEVVDAEITDAPLNPADRIDAPASPAAAEPAEPAPQAYPLRPRTLATDDQKIQIAMLLESADIIDAERQRIATVAGAKTYLFDDAVKEIARLEKLVPPPTDPPIDD